MAEEREHREKEGSEFVEKPVSLNRVTKVVKGGRRFAIAALDVVGDGKGKVGYGTGKAKEAPYAMKKAGRSRTLSAGASARRRLFPTASTRKAG